VKAVRVTNASRGTILADRAWVADICLSRLRGLLGRRGLAPGEGLLLTPCRGIHTFGMRFPIDALYIAGNGRVILACTLMRPNRWGPWVRAATCVLELPAGTVMATATTVGDRLAVSAVQADPHARDPLSH
jgi:uncharacterized membrane protein (UPF0127 family)